MKFNLIKTTILENTILIILFAILISCDSTGDSSQDSMTDEIPVSPTTSPIPSAMPTNPAQTPLPTSLPNPAPDEPLDDLQSQVLSLINNARAQSRNCGSDFFPAAPPVSWDERIEDAALIHSEDMAQNQNISHTGTDGSNAGDRLLIQGYNWSAWGENILVGLDDPADAIDAWIGSTGHCSIIMNPSLLEVGVGVALGSFQGRIESYWTLLFATEN